MKKNLLIVEDHELTRFGLKTAFEDVDYIGTIYEASTGESAIDIFKNNKIDLVIMDLGLPKMDGIETTQKIHSLNPDVKIIILTSHNDEKEVLNSLKAGANAYCSKEINLQRLVQVVQSVSEVADGLTRALHILYCRQLQIQKSVKKIQIIKITT